MQRGYRSAGTDEERTGTLYRYTITGCLTAYRYDLAGNMTEEIRYLNFQKAEGVGGAVHILIMRECSYDSDHDLTGLKIPCGVSLLADNRYTYDGDGNRLEKRQLSGTTRYVYDALIQMVK